MIERLIVFSIRQRFMVILLAIVFLFLGVLAATRVPIDAVPDVTNVQVQILTSAPAFGPLDVETYITAPVERAMAGIPGLEEVRSISRPGISAVTCVFNEHTDLFFARDQIDQKLQDAKKEIPEEYGIPTMGPISSGLGEIFHFEVKGDVPIMEKKALLEWQIAPRLKMVPGVVDINIFGGESKSFEVALSSQKLASYKLSVSEVIKAVEQNHFIQGGAYIVDGREHLTVRGEGRIQNLSDLENVVVATLDAKDGKPGGSPVYLKDLGLMHIAPLVRYGVVTRDARPKPQDEAVIGVVMMSKGANSSDTVFGVKRAILEMEPSFPKGVSVDVYYDRTELVSRTVHTVEKNLIEASFLVVAVLFLTLGSFRAGSIVAIAIPFALFGVFVGMWLFGISGNLVSLGAIDFGLVVDGAIIIVENAMRRLGQKRAELGRKLTPKEHSDIVLDASKEVRKATAFGEAIIALVYLPIIALQNVEGRMFRPMALNVLFALATAFVFSLTVAPALASLLLPHDKDDHEGFLIQKVRKAYVPLLKRSLRHPKGIAFASLSLFLLSLAVFSTMGREFLPKLDEGTMVIAMVRLPSVSLDESKRIVRQVEETLNHFPEVKSVVSRTGRAEIAVDPMSINMTDIYVLLKPKEEWKTSNDRFGLIEKFDEALQQNVPGAGFSFSQPIEMNTNDLLAGISSDLALHIYGHDLNLLKQTGEQIVHLFREIPGAKDVRAEQIAGLNTLTIHVNRVEIARNGLDVSDVMQAVRAVGGIEVGQIYEGPAKFPIQIRWDSTVRQSSLNLGTLPIRTPSGSVLPLGQLVRFEEAPGPSQISRERLSRRVTVQLNVRGRDMASFVEEAKVRIRNKMTFPVGFTHTWAGEYERLQSATKQLAIVVPISLLLIFILLMYSFGRLKPALVILLNVPTSISGGIAALFLRGEEFSISAGVGFIALFGVAVLNGLVLISNIEQRLSQHEQPAFAVFHGAESRLRAVLTTALVASLGFVPMALATGAGAEVQRPLATVVIGGLVTSTLLTLFVLPTIYLSMLERPKTAS